MSVNLFFPFLNAQSFSRSYLIAQMWEGIFSFITDRVRSILEGITSSFHGNSRIEKKFSFETFECWINTNSMNMIDENSMVAIDVIQVIEGPSSGQKFISNKMREESSALIKKLKKQRRIIASSTFLSKRCLA